MAGIVAKAKVLNGHDAKFQEYSVDDFPPMIWLWDREQQTLLVEKKTAVFATAKAAGRAFQAIVNNIELAELNLRADIEPILNNNEHTFWQEYDKFEFVQSVSFDLIPPNLFGNTEKEMKKALNESAEITNANKITTTFENKDSKLKLKSESWLSNMINWCRKGGGHWSLKGQLQGNNKKIQTVHSEKTAKIVVMEGKGITEFDLTNYSPEDIVQILELYRPGYNYNDLIEEGSDD